MLNRKANRMNNENYARDPRKGIVRALVAAGWEDVDDGLWQKGDKRLLVDSVGVFLFQLKDGWWTRIAGLSHNLISYQDLAGNYLHFSGQWLNLISCQMLNILTGKSL